MTLKTWVDWNGKFPVVNWFNGKDWRRTLVREVSLAPRCRTQGMSQIVSRVWFMNCVCCMKPFVARLPFEKFCSAAHQVYYESQKSLVRRAGTRKCRVCKKEYVKKIGISVSTVCSKNCRDAFGRTLGIARSAISRALDKNLAVDAIDPFAVFAIQKWRCQLCGKQCSRERHIHDDRAELDHIISLKRDGTHTWDNVQTACHSCNTIKSSGSNEFAKQRIYERRIESERLNRDVYQHTGMDLRYFPRP